MKEQNLRVIILDKVLIMKMKIIGLVKIRILLIGYGMVILK